MTRVFVDTFFYIALLNPRDPFHTRVKELERETRDDERFTSDAILTELLDHYGDRGHHLRRAAVEFVAFLPNAPETRIIRQTPDLWEAGLDLYRRRPDKGYGHTDCMSMAICREHRIRSVLTHDHHFAQEGLEILL